MTLGLRVALRICVVLALAPPVARNGAANAQDTPAAQSRVVARLARGGKVELVNLDRGTTRTVYQVRRIPSIAISMSPTGKYIAFVEVDTGIVRGHDYETLPTGTLVVVDTTGTDVLRVAGGVPRYAWCGSDCIAFLRGPFNESDLGFGVTGAGVADLTSREVRSLDGPPWPYALAYASFDSSLYAVVYRTRGAPEVVRYDPSANVLRPTTHRGMEFSRDGQYYLGYSESTYGPNRARHVFEARTDMEVALPDVDRIGRIERWLPSGPSQLLLRRTAIRPPGSAPTRPPRGPMLVLTPRTQHAEVDYVIYDVATHTVVRTLRAEFPSWGAPSGFVPFISGGRANVVARP